MHSLNTEDYLAVKTSVWMGGGSAHAVQFWYPKFTMQEMHWKVIVPYVPILFLSDVYQRIGAFTLAMN